MEDIKVIEYKGTTLSVGIDKEKDKILVEVVGRRFFRRLTVNKLTQGEDGLVGQGLSFELVNNQRLTTHKPGKDEGSRFDDKKRR